MKRVCLLLLAVLGFATSHRPGLRVKFDIGLRPGRNFFFDVPRHIDDAVASAWTQMDRPPGPMPSLVMYCSDERVLCSIYDPITRYIAGIQVALPMSQFSDPVFDWEVQGFIPWAVPAERSTYMTKQLYFISEATLSKSVEQRLQAARADEVLQEGAVWPVGFHSHRTPISINGTDIASSPDYTKQACIPWMGQHYYYKMTPETECKADVLLNWFPLVDQEKLIGVGFIVFGVMPEIAGQRFFFERPPKLAVQAIVPRGPQCLYELAEKPTLTTMHIYFIDEPWKVGCWPF